MHVCRKQVEMKTTERETRQNGEEPQSWKIQQKKHTIRTHIVTFRVQKVLITQEGNFPEAF